jgi:hypothetical protein
MKTPRSLDITSRSRRIAPPFFPLRNQNFLSRTVTQSHTIARAKLSIVNGYATHGITRFPLCARCEFPSAQLTPRRTT